MQPTRLHRVLVPLAVAGIASLGMAPVLDDPEPEPTPVAPGCRLVDVEGTEDTADDVTLCEQQLFVRAGDTPLSNATSAVFSPDEPTGAPVGGAGLGGAVTDILAQGNAAHGLEVNGTFTGAVDSIEVEVWLLMPNGARSRHGTTPTIAIDGFDGFGPGLVETTVETGANGIARATFRIDGLLELWDALQYSYDPAVEHTLRLNLSPFYVGDDGAYLYDGTEVPSNVVLNAAG